MTMIPVLAFHGLDDKIVPYTGGDPLMMEPPIHDWPGSAVMPKAIASQAINATDIMWDFFKAHPMP